jgi:hypothetical protein
MTSLTTELTCVITEGLDEKVEQRLCI